MEVHQDIDVHWYVFYKLQFYIHFSGNGFPDTQFSLHKVPIPRFAVGIVIGRNGEMIKKIQNDAGVRIQFKPGEYLCLIF